MKKLIVFVAVFLYGTALFADNTAPELTAWDKWAENFNWSLLWSGSWEESKTLHNRGEFKLDFLPSGLTLRGEVLDRRPLDFKLDSPWGDPEKRITNFLGGLYHKPTGSRLLYGVLDEWGLSARIRNPWIRSPPYAENHKPLIADLKTAASSTKNDELYLYLSSPFLNLLTDTKIRGFLSAQSETGNFTPAISGGLDMVFPKKTGLLFEVFYTGATLPAKRSSTWFSNPPSLPERKFNLYSVGLLFYNQLISVSSDWAMSETFAWGTDIYGNFGVTLTPLLPFGARRRPRPLSVSFALDGAGERVVYRDGAGHGEGFRGAAKIEWKGRGNSLLRLNSVLRSTEFGAGFNRSSTGFYYRFPATRRQDVQFPVRLTRISLTADRNAENLDKINDRLSGYVGFSVFLGQIALNTPLGVNLNYSIRGLAAAEEVVSPYPVFDVSRTFDSAGASCEFIWSPRRYQFRSKTGFTYNEKNGGIWDFSFSSAARFGYGRVSIKVFSEDFPENWNWTVSWRLEIK